MVGQASCTLGKVLVVDEDPRRAGQISSRLKFLNFEPVNVATVDELKGIRSDGVAIMVGDVSHDAGAAQRVGELAETYSSLPVLKLKTDDGGDTLELKGAHIWPVDAPLRRAQLQHLLDRAIRYKGAERRSRITGNSRSIRAVRKDIEQVAGFDTTVLVTGESGTGKELVAKTIHDLSRRANSPFVPINCGAIPAELLESELFGHEKGAFTGAQCARKGRFELAEGGTLFLDEIGDMSLEMQAKLLRVLQERTYERVGSNRSRACNVRIVAATHRNLKEAVADGRFREDLFYRLNVFPVQMPPLRKRASDLPELLGELLIQHGNSNPGALRLKADALSALARYRWPGNVRELSNLVERLAILHPDGEIGVMDLPEKYREGADDASQLVGEVPFGSMNLKDHLADIERTLIENALAQTGGVVAQAARLLSLRRTTLVEKLGKYGLDARPGAVAAH